jgi:hypothetical protein
MMIEVIAYNPQKGRLETITVHFAEDTTTWFDGTASPESVSMITDLDGALLISRDGRSYPGTSVLLPNQKQRRKSRHNQRLKSSHR